MQCKVLVVDDDPILVISLKLHFSDIGIEFEVAGDGQEALEKLESFEPDIILSDIMMPRMDGYELRKQLRQNPDTARIPFIFMSAKCGITDQMTAFRLGIDDYVCKPFQISDLVERMQRAIERARKIRSFHSKADFSGDLTQLVWTDMLQIMELNHKSGMLVFRKPSGEPIGRILFSNGRLVNAQAGPFEGEEAFFTLMTIKKGSFEFSDKPVKAPNSIKSNNTSLLLQGSQMIDKYKKLLRLVPDLNLPVKLMSQKDNFQTDDLVFHKWSSMIFPMIHKGFTVREILNSGVMSPIRAASILMFLLKSRSLKFRDNHSKTDEKYTKSFSTFFNTALIKIIRRIEKQLLTGVLEFHNRHQNQAVFFEKGQVVHAFHGKTFGKKALFRIFSEQGGGIKFVQQPVSVTPTFEISESSNILFEEFCKEIEILKEVNREFWTKSVIVDHEKAETFLRDKNLSGLRYFISLAQEHTEIYDIIDSSIHTDGKTYQQIIFLLNIGMLRIKEES